MSPLDDLRARLPLPGWRGPAWIVIGLVIAAVGWAAVARLDEVAIASGEVVPMGQVKVVQHLEGGIIERIDVANGQRVAAGDSLLQLSLGAGGINPEEVSVRIDGLMMRRARLTAEGHDRKLALPPDVPPHLKDLVRTEREAYDSRRRQLESALIVLDRQVRQRELEIEELEAKQKATSADLSLARQRLAMSKDLLERELMPKMEHLELAAEVERLQGRQSELRSAIPKLREARGEARERKREAVLRFRRSAIEELGQTELEIAQNRKLLEKASDQAERTEVRSPIDGVVKNLRFHTIGGVVRPGDAIMEIVPIGQKLVIEAKLDPVDVGYVEPGQPAVVKITTYDFIRYGGLDGTVVSVAPDSTTDVDGQPYFRVVIETAKSHLGDRIGAYPITPGMQALVDIQTGSRSVIAYLVSPVLKLRHEAFRER